MDERTSLTGGRNRDGSALNPITNLFQFCQLSLLALVVVIPLLTSWFIVQPGEIAVVVTLGHVASYGPGPHWRFPLVSHVHMFNAKTQKLDEQHSVPTKEGLTVQLDTAVLFRLDTAKAGQLYTQVGVDYVNIVIKPEAASATRGLTSESQAKDLYTSGRSLIQDHLKTELTASLEPRGIIIEDVLLKDIVLPQQLSDAIEAKVKAEQESERMEFVLTKEKQEAQRKAIEAQGIADFQQIVSQGISNELLKWKGVEATEKLADSCNTKVVIMGNSADGLPVILSADGGDGRKQQQTTI